MIAKKKAPTARDGGALDDVLSRQTAPVGYARKGLKSQRAKVRNTQEGSEKSGPFLLGGRRSQRLHRREDGSVTFPRLGAISVPLLSGVAGGVSEENHATSAACGGWARKQRIRDTYRVQWAESSARPAPIICANESAADNVVSILDAVSLLDNEREGRTMGLAVVTVSAPNGSDRERIDHAGNVAKQLWKKAQRAGHELRLLRVAEQTSAGYHEHMIFTFPLARWGVLDKLVRQRNVARFDLDGANPDEGGYAVDVKSADTYRNGAIGLGRYAVKEAARAAPLDVGRSRVVVNGALARDMRLAGMPVPVKTNAKRGLQ